MARILVIDDSPTAVAFVKRAVRYEGHAVEALTSFVSLASTVRDEPPDLVLLDLCMPALSGAAMGQLIRKHESRQIAILIYSSRPEHELAEAARAMGAAGHVSKEAPPEALRDAIARALGERRTDGTAGAP